MATLRVFAVNDKSSTILAARDRGGAVTYVLQRLAKLLEVLAGIYRGSFRVGFGLQSCATYYVAVS